MGGDTSDGRREEFYTLDSPLGEKTEGLFEKEENLGGGKVLDCIELMLSIKAVVM